MPDYDLEKILSSPGKWKKVRVVGVMPVHQRLLCGFFFSVFTEALCAGQMELVVTAIAARAVDDLVSNTKIDNGRVTGKVLEVKFAFTIGRKPDPQAPCASGNVDGQAYWMLEKIPGGLLIRHVATGQLLEMHNQNVARLAAHNLGGTESSIWGIKDAGNGRVYLYNQKYGQFLKRENGTAYRWCLEPESLKWEITLVPDKGLLLLDSAGGYLRGDSRN